MLNGRSIAGYQRCICISFFICPNFVPIFFCYEQHAETFTFVFIQMLVMHFVCPANGANIHIVASCKKFYALVNNYIMHNKISKAIQHNAKANCSEPINILCNTKRNTQLYLGWKKSERMNRFFQKLRDFFCDDLRANTKETHA